MPHFKEKLAQNGFTVDATVFFEVYCDKCGAGLCKLTNVEGNAIYITPCPKCSSDDEIQDKNAEIEALKAHIVALYKRLYVETGESPTIPEMHRLQTKLGVRIQ